MPMGKFPYSSQVKNSKGSAKPSNRKYSASVVEGLKNKMSARIKDDNRGSWVK
jgi:hypothetical protein